MRKPSKQVLLMLKRGQLAAQNEVNKHLAAGRNVYCRLNGTPHWIVPNKLHEKAVSVDEATTRGLALHISTVANKWYILYDASEAIKAVKKDLEEHLSAQNGVLDRTHASIRLTELLKDCVVATVSVNSVKDEMWNASTVQFSAAQKGYGPLLYDIVMALEGGLTSDREIVSNPAKTIWNRYLNNRQDVIHRKIDDITDPKTEPLEDDGEVFKPDTDENALNYAYFLKTSPNVTALLENDKKVKKFINENIDTNFDNKSLNLIFVSCGRTFFSKKYK